MLNKQSLPTGTAKSLTKEFIKQKNKMSCDVILLDDEFKFESKNNIYFHFGLGLVKDILDTKKVESIFYCFESFNKDEFVSVSSSKETSDTNPKIFS